MTKYTVNINAGIQTSKEVEADSPEQAKRIALQEFEYTYEAYRLEIEAEEQ